ncbi:hypothetical protein HOLleu_10033 [Holothuria leucospilota]|uniref:G-protein coupled receptors family 1 profile domain-containing protein n=1 Tax=Holothuria leucospilota TaxID=206669 RepID=A0A9Q1CDL8_HOLLE|nr:hypothetical protein HOLleu_10033 [Holothuria leucospilota]
MEKLTFIPISLFFHRRIDNYGICCLFKESVDCRTPPSPFKTCDSMLPNNLLRVALWVICLISLLTNMVVIVGRIKYKIPAMRNMFSSTVSDKQNALLINLAVADFLMGVYLLAIGIADAVFGKAFFLSALNWRNGIVCKGIGLVGFVANIASILTLTFVSVERFFTIVFPFGKYTFPPKLIATICVTIWVTCGLMALTPIILSESVKQIFGFSDICMGLPFVSLPDTSKYYDTFDEHFWYNQLEMNEITDVKDFQWVFSQIVYIYFSATCVTVITLCYIAIFISAIVTKIKSGRPGGNKDEIKMALRISVIVGTDLLCWLPVIITGILSQTGLSMSTDVYVWFAIFVMPINSALNPFIYTIPTIKRRKKNEPSFIAE